MWGLNLWQMIWEFRWFPLGWSLLFLPYVCSILLVNLLNIYEGEGNAFFGLLNHRIENPEALRRQQTRSRLPGWIQWFVVPMTVFVRPERVLNITSKAAST